jgi:hypothetical protein
MMWLTLNGGSAAARQRCGSAPVGEVRCSRSGGLRLIEELLQDLHAVREVVAGEPVLGKNRAAASSPWKSLADRGGGGWTRHNNLLLAR